MARIEDNSYVSSPVHRSHVFDDLKEHVMSVDNNVNRPLILKGDNAVTMLIVRLIMLEPGTFQTHPDMGVGIVSRYRHSNEIDLSELRRRINNQIETYLPMFTNVEVDVDLDNDRHCLLIYITSDQLNAVVPFDTESLMVINYGTLDDMKY